MTRAEDDLVTTEQAATLLAGTTKGAWKWAVSKVNRKVELEGDGGNLTVLSFARWGMTGAAPVFWFWKGNISDEPKRADAVAVPALGRDHHKTWFARIDHPDARLIEAAPDLARTVIALHEALAAERAVRVAAEARVAVLEAVLKWLDENATLKPNARKAIRAALEPGK